MTAMNQKVIVASASNDRNSIAVALNLLGDIFTFLVSSANYEATAFATIVQFLTAKLCRASPACNHYGFM